MAFLLSSFSIYTLSKFSYHDTQTNSLQLANKIRRLSMSALNLFSPLSVFTFARLERTSCMSLRTSTGGCVIRQVQCMSTTITANQTITRRSANYQPSIWDYDYIQSLRSEFTGESCSKLVNKLKGEVRKMFENKVDTIAQLELIDVLQKLGLSYHFEDEIKNSLTSVHNEIQLNGLQQRKHDLYATSMAFRLLRQNGYYIPPGVFNRFKDQTGNFKACLGEDTEGLLNLYEASYLLLEGESILEDARDFTIKHLQEYLKQSKDQYLSKLVSHALELPLDWRMQRLETRWFIDLYGRRKDMNPTLLQLAKLDFNMVQTVHQEDLKYGYTWWRNTGLGEKLTFARDRLVENFFWTVGYTCEPQFAYCRRMSTKSNALIITLDDVYDIYGTLNELEIFTEAVERWDINAMEQLPEYMRICFLALFNSVNEMAFDTLKEQGFNVIPYLRKVWADLCKSFLLEAKWYYSGYKPTLQEYLDNAWITISIPVMLLHAYVFVTNPITKEAMQHLGESDYHNIIRYTGMIVRLADDLGTSSDELKRGDVPKSIQYYMNETGASEEDARKHIQYLISETWKKMNRERVTDSPYYQTLTTIAINLARMGLCTYQYGDGHGVVDGETKDRILSLLIQPISLA